MPNEISRTFRELSKKYIAEAENPELLAHWGMPHGFGWDSLLTARRILIVSEAGVGKTYECGACQQKLWANGEPAFFIELAALADEDLLDVFSTQERERFDAWMKAQSEVATFFLDSIDELKITQKSFGQALKRLGRALAGNLGRARIVITTRPIPFDRELIARHLPIPPSREAQATAEGFAEIAMQRDRKERTDDNTPTDWRNVGLMPLTRDQIKTFAEIQGVADAGALLADVEKRHAEEYAQRPQDLIELCSDWKEQRHIRKHGDQVAANVVNKLKPRTDRVEKAQLSDERAFEGASRLALAALLTRKLTIRYSAESDKVQSAEAALDAGKLLVNWSQAEKDTLLERGLFGFATYGRVRFHHRSVLEYLAAKRLDALLSRGTPVRAVKRILFAEALNDRRVVRPSLRPVAAWLSLWHESIYCEVLRREPEVLLNHGDPESLSPKQRREVLEAYVGRYGKGGWRGLQVPAVQVQRFASAELDTAVQDIWARGVENAEVRDLLLELIGTAKLTGCADIVYGVVMDRKASHRERLNALDALVALNDRRLGKVATSIAKATARWPRSTARSAALRLFPAHLNGPQLCAILPTVSESQKTIGDLSWHLPQLITERSIIPAQLDCLRSGLTKLILDDVEWRGDKWPNIRTKRPDLIAGLIATCNRQFREGVRTRDLFRSTVTALQFINEDRIDDEQAKELRAHLADASPLEREQAFWDGHAFMQTVRPATDAWHRVFMLSHHGGIRLNPEKDREWVIGGLRASQKPVFEREMMLWAAMVEVMPPGGDVRKAHDDLKQYVPDAPTLAAVIDARLKPPPVDKELQRLEAENRRHRQKSERDEAKAHASWVNFWNEVAEHPDDVFADTRAENTAWNLWQAMERSGSNSREAGWNRRFIEEQFGREVADRLRSTLLRMWRKDRPTLRSERPEDKKNSFLVRWQLGLAAIYAEAEDPNWAASLIDEEARLAARFAPLELNGFPSWLDDLVAAHPTAVDAILGNELSLAMREGGAEIDATILLQNIRHARPRVTSSFTARIKAWLDSVRDKELTADSAVLGRLSAAVDILMQAQEPEIRADLKTTAEMNLAQGLDRPAAKIWLPVLMQLDPEAGVKALEGGLKKVPVAQRGLGVDWFGALFGFGHRGGAIELSRREFTPELLLRLVRLAYMYVRPTDDARHEDSYSPDERDHAEQGRNALLSALLATNGPEGWAVKQKMAADPLFAHFKDRIVALANERAAEEVDGSALSESEVVILDTYGEVPPTTRDEMFAITRDRLDDIDDLLLQDESPRELWASITDEKVMRRAVARELRVSRNHMYTVDQEAATADEKETDIRLRATRSNQQAVIELKIGEKPRTAKDLRTTITNQLVKKYMAPDECRAGCLLITLSTNKTWSHPARKAQRLDFSSLIAFLQGEADRIASNLGGNVRLLVKGLDLRPRLSTEKEGRPAAKRKRSRRGSPTGSSKARVGTRRKVVKRKRKAKVRRRR